MKAVNRKKNVVLSKVAIKEIRRRERAIAARITETHWLISELSQNFASLCRDLLVSRRRIRELMELEELQHAGFLKLEAEHLALGPTRRLPRRAAHR
jgi:hypothetical protein